ncbi:hypothetical protein UA08_07010 [Talaromyces atroroseus]|uniref:Protection of telomeres protein 1 n=1 Tax=Talaromyces atroroseus TaxID=1441469 RepID=A0A225AHC8_TALAT|nr:hypothetical protein UA08_07010 [Talaromyces atroroseus]OKL57574.1 hypothetical protein UA08_07010 [Talaromyces atroroseus]
MPAAIPPRFVSVDTAKSTQGHHNLIGVVVDCLSKSKTGGTSFVVTFTIKDADYGKGNQSWTGLKIKYFNNNEHRLPDLRVNDVILLRRLRVRPYQGSLLGIASNTDNVAWAVFRQPEERASLAIPACSPGSSALNLEETTYANWLLDTLARSRSNTSSTPVERHRTEPSTDPIGAKQQNTAVAKKRDRFSLIKNLSMDTFVDLTVHVVKTWYQDDRVHLYVTDYTVNKSLFDYRDKSDDDADGDGGTFGDEFGFMTRNTREKRTWEGPMGRMTVQVTLWDPHSTYAKENVREDSYVALSNVRVKTDKMNGIMEGVMHTDKKFPHKLGIRILDEDDDEPRFADLKKRKREYWRQNRMNKRKVAEDFGEEDGVPKKNAKKRRKEQLRQKKQQEQRQRQQRKEEGQTEIPIAVISAKGPNPHIQAKDPSRACRKLSEILANESHNISLPGNIQYRLPFQNVKYRTVVRVVDFFPPDIADFAVPYRPRRYSAPSSSSSSSSENEDGDDINPHTAGIRWEWRFCLLVEDDKAAPGQARDRIKLFVSGAEAEFLLKLDAVNLRENRSILNRLKEKLCVLWGDLEEYKNAGMRDGQQKGPSQRPFTCCVKEYGVRCTCQRKAILGDGDDSDSNGVVLGPEHNQHCLGWERRFALFGTTINE